ncbi:alpha/beta fold hydrolase [uncultured Fibrella sp.]|uniref:alpha/beta fold hydrolase n=1 Tax=uncultured Fibrella sp. TaxID=1284596 RepID=UPI0035CC89BD
MLKRPTLVFLHGHPLSPVIWDFLASALSDDYAIIKPDFSRLTDHTSIDAYADELQGQLSSSEMGACVLIGHSMGGYIALAAAEKYPDRVKGIVLVNSTAFADPDTDQQRQKREEAKQKLETEGGHAFVEKAIPAMFSEQHRQSLADTIQQLVDAHKNLPEAAMLAGLQAIRTRPDRSDFLKNADLPVLIIAGREDKAIPFERSEELKQKLPSAEFVVLEQSGHLGMIEEPEQLVLAIKPFLEKITVD